MKLRTFVTTLILTLCLFGCSPTTRPLVWKAKGVDINNFSAFEIQQAINPTGKRIEQEILSLLTAYLIDEFEVKNLQLIDYPQTKSNVLTVRTEILVYEVKLFMSPAPPLKDKIAQCILRTRLYQKSSNIVVAEIVTVNQIDVGQGLFEPKNSEDVLKESAAAVAAEVAKII